MTRQELFDSIHEDFQSCEILQTELQLAAQTDFRKFIYLIRKINEVHKTINSKLNQIWELHK
jgi:hypothetical protein